VEEAYSAVAREVVSRMAEGGGGWPPGSGGNNAGNSGGLRLGKGGGAGSGRKGKSACCS